MGNIFETILRERVTRHLSVFDLIMHCHHSKITNKMDVDKIKESIGDASEKVKDMMNKMLAMIQDLQNEWVALDEKFKLIFLVLVVIALWELVEDNTILLLLVVGVIIVFWVMTL